MSFPLTSIIILTKNNIQFTERCIWSIFENTNELQTPYEIIILDEGSIDGTKEFCEQHKNKIKYIDAREYKSFSSRNNYGVKLSKGDFLWFLNNDTELINNNLYNMLVTFSDPNVGIVGNMHIFPDGTLNHIGIGISDQLDPVHIFPHEDPTLPYINHDREIDIVTAASVILRRDVFEKVGGFNESYTWGFEDVDLCLKLKEMGYKNYCVSNAKLIHFGQSTYGRQEDDEKNRKIFIQKWKNKLKANLKELYREKEQYYSFTSNPARIIKKTIITFLKKVLNLNNTSKILVSKSSQEEALINTYIIKSKTFTAFSDITDRLSRSVKDKFILVDSIEKLYNIKHQPPEGIMSISSAHFFPDYIYPAPDFVRDYRTFDINYERSNYDKSDYWIESIKKNNMIMLASSKYCADFLIKSGVNSKRVHIVAHGYNPSITKFDFNNTKNNEFINILVIINTNDESRYGTEYLSKALELLNKNDPNLSSKINLIVKNYGGKPTSPFFKTKEYLNFIENNIKVEYISEFLSEDDLAKIYYKSDILVAPFRGEGFGMKILDAAAAGLPIISPFYGGPRDYLEFSTHIPVKYNLVPVTGLDHMLLMLNESYLWAEVDYNDLYKQIKYSINNINKLKEEALSKRKKIREEFSYSKKWEKIKEIDEKIKKEVVLKKFEFYNEEIQIDISTSKYKLLDNIEQSVIINTINKYENLEKLFTHIDSYIKSNEFSGEYLVIDDASSKSPIELIKKFDHLPIRYIKYLKWHGAAFAKDFGLRYARGKNIIIMGDDIKPMPGFFKRHYEFYKNNNFPYLLMGHVEWDKEIRNNPIAEFATKVTSFQFGFEEIRNNNVIDYTHVYTSNVSFRRSDIVSVSQHFHADLIFFEDGTWANELEHKGFKIFYDRKAYALHNHHADNWLDWIINRSRNIGKNNLPAICINPKYDKFIGVNAVLNLLFNLFEKINYNLEQVSYLSKSFDNYVNNLLAVYKDLELIDSQYGYDKNIRTKMYSILTEVANIFRVLGIAESINKNNPEELSKALTFCYFSTFQQLTPDFINNLGFLESTRAFIYSGRKRFPLIFNPIYKVGVLAKKTSKSIR